MSIFKKEQPKILKMGKPEEEEHKEDIKVPEPPTQYKAQEVVEPAPIEDSNLKNYTDSEKLDLILYGLDTIIKHFQIQLETEPLPKEIKTEIPYDTKKEKYYVKEVDGKVVIIRDEPLNKKK